MRISARTRVFALLGDPVTHSLSPRMHNAGFSAAGIDATYVAVRCTAERVVSAMHLLVESGGGGNITVPHKRVAAACAAPASFEATLGAVNTFTGTSTGLAVVNTDIDGIVGSVAGLMPTPGAWLILGTGGSARAAAVSAMRSGAAVAVSSRDPGRAASFGAWCESIGATLAPRDAATVVINATPLGLAPTDQLPTEPDTLPAIRAALDLTYVASGTTAWCEAWRARGVAADDGKETLLLQGVAAWRHWFPDCLPPVEVMRAALRDGMD